MRKLLRALLMASLAVSFSYGRCWAEPADEVNAFIGTGMGTPDFGLGNAGGDTPPGAAYPFGMVLWSLDTTNAAGGYRYEHHMIQGFSLTHFSGRGVPCYHDLPFLPSAHRPVASPGTHWSDFALGFSHADEKASPGYYRVRLKPNDIVAEFTVTRRTGLGRF